MPSSDTHTPTQIQQHDARTLSIRWADGAESLLDVRALRLACGCANCVDEWSGEALLAPNNVPDDVAPVAMRFRSNGVTDTLRVSTHSNGFESCPTTEN